MLAGTIPDTAGGGIFVGGAPPSSSLTYKVWFRIDGAGRPLGAYMFYNGNWRKVYTAGIGEVRMYFGNGNNFDATGLGVVGGDMDGWAICNGSNGTPNMTDDRFPMGVNWNGSAWVASDGSQSGGQNSHHIGVGDIPALQVSLGTAAGRWQSGGGGGWLTMPPYGSPTSSYTVGVTDAQGNPTSGLVANNALPLPQYQVFGFVMFVGYQ